MGCYNKSEAAVNEKASLYRYALYSNHIFYAVAKVVFL